MGRYTDADSDAERLPEGMKRIGYDADTQVYTFKDADGTLWEGSPGAEYGRLHRVGAQNLISREEAAAEDAAVAYHNRHSWRMMMPFLLLVCLVPVLVFRVLPWLGGAGAKAVDCGEGAMEVTVNAGDTCWNIAQEHGMGLDELRELNEERSVGLDCEKLGIGKSICVKVP